jgi:Protein of unknown function (DUF2844)
MTKMNLPRCTFKICAQTLAAALLFATPFPAHAVLGDNAGSVLTDQTRLKGTLRSVDRGAYVMHEITTSTGAVREFVTPGGAVFGVAWEGQFPPDFQHLLGPYYQQANQAASPQTRPRRAPIVINTPGLVFQESGHTRNFHGVAYIPQLVPNGMQVSDIR